MRFSSFSLFALLLATPLLHAQTAPAESASAPALVLYHSGLDRLGGLGWLASLVFCIACALRLARFNVMIDDPDLPPWRKHYFVGMPAPAGAVVGLLPVYIQFLSAGAEPAAKGWIAFEAVYVIGVALLMASRGAAFCGQVDRPGSARICRRGADRRRRCAAVDRQLSACRR